MYSELAADAEPTLIQLAPHVDRDSLVFHIAGQEMIRLAGDGNIYVKGKLVENDKEVVRGLRHFLIGLGFNADPPWTPDDFDGPCPNRYERINNE